MYSTLDSKFLQKIRFFSKITIEWVVKHKWREIGPLSDERWRYALEQIRGRERSTYMLYGIIFDNFAYTGLKKYKCLLFSFLYFSACFLYLKEYCHDRPNFLWLFRNPHFFSFKKKQKSGHNMLFSFQCYKLIFLSMLQKKSAVQLLQNSCNALRIYRSATRLIRKKKSLSRKQPRAWISEPKSIGPAIALIWRMDW